MNYTFSNTGKFTFVSNKAVEMLSSSPMLENIENKYAVIPMGVDDIFYEKPIIENNNSQSLNLLYFGRLVDYKGVDLLIESVKKAVTKENINIKVELIGSGVDKKLLQISAFIKVGKNFQV